METLLNIPLNRIEANPVALRTVDLEGEDYINLVNSIRSHGVLSAISVVPATLGDGKTPKLVEGEQIYRIVDGLHRVTAAREAGRTEIPAQVMLLDDLKILFAQLAGNSQRVETHPWEFSQHLERILMADATRTKAELATLCCKSIQWLDSRLGLVNLHKDIGAIVDAGKITVTNACELARLRPPEEQLKFVVEAQVDPPAVFASKVKQRIKEIRQARMAGRNPAERQEWQPTAHVRKLSELKAEVDSPTILPQLLKAANITEPLAAATFALKWAVQLDEQSILLQKEKAEAVRREAEATKVRAAAERAEKKAKEATARAANLN